MLAKEIMTAQVITIQEKETIREAIARMLANGISGLPVVDEQGRLKGVLSESDLILGGAEPQVPQKLLNAIVKLLTHEEVELKSAHDTLTAQLAQVSQSPVSEFMTAPAYSVTLETPLEVVAELITTHDINRVPVVDGQNRVVGIISRHDLLRGMYQ